MEGVGVEVKGDADTGANTSIALAVCFFFFLAGERAVEEEG